VFVFVFVAAAAVVSFSLAVVAVAVVVDAAMNETIVGSDAVSLQQGIDGSRGLGSNGVRVRIRVRVRARFLLAHPRWRVFDAGPELCVFFPQNFQGLFQVGRQGLFAEAALLGVLAVSFATDFEFDCG